MPCPESQILTRFVYEDGTPGEMQEVRRHLQGCVQCRGEVESLKILDEAVQRVVQTETRRGVPSQECPDATVLAGYLDGVLSAEERERLEEHLVRCPSCLHQFIDADRSRTLSDNYRLTPSHLLKQAVNLAGSPKPSLWIGLGYRIQEGARKWMEPLVSHPRWALAGVGTCAVLVIALLMALPQYLEEQKTPDHPRATRTQGPQGFAFGTGETVVAESNIALTPELRSGLLAYEREKTNASRAQLVALLRKAAPQMPFETVTEIEIQHGLQTRVESRKETPAEIKVRVMKDGILVVSEVS
ncbi:MAG: zf-HC2 domain-containing protein [Deltaproteobacteria bacterium]|nr:zf-HC2 domain-containing protein [Deltaproteobacteria bacterium]